MFTICICILGRVNVARRDVQYKRTYKKSIKFTTNIKQLLECLNSPLIQTEF